MGERGSAHRWHHAVSSRLRTRTLVLVVSGAILGGAGLAYLLRSRRTRDQQLDNERAELEEGSTTDATCGRRDTMPPIDEEGQVDAHPYLTSTGPNKELLKMMDVGGVAGGFGEVSFWRTMSGQELALKVAKDTESGRRQQKREIEFLVKFKSLHPTATCIVDVIETRTTPFDMLLLRKEAQTLTAMLEGATTIDVVAVAKALSGILTAIDMLDGAGFVQRDIKGDNILIGKDGDGILADFGLCITTGDSSLPAFLGDGTAEYSAPEIVNKLSGSNLCTELYSLFVVFVEAVMMRHPFGVEDIFDAKNDRIELLEDDRKYLIEDLDDLTDQLESLKVEQEDGAGKDGEEDMERSWGEERRQLEDDLVKVSAKLEAVRVRQWRLGVRSPRQWKPSKSAQVVLAKLGEPLGVFKKFNRRTRQREEKVSGEAKANPSKLFEGDDWVDWLPGPSRADCKEGVKVAVNFLLSSGVFDPNAASRPQDVAAARGLMAGAVALYEEQRTSELELEQDEGVGISAEDDRAGG